MVENDSPLAIFGRQVSAAMARAGLGVGDVAKALRVTPEMARRYREGMAMPKPDKLRKLARLLGMSEAELVFGGTTQQRGASPIALYDQLVEEERAIVETYRQLPPFGQKALRARAAELLENFGAPSKKNPFGKGGAQ